MKVEARIDHTIYDRNSNVKAYASINVDDFIVVHGVKVVENSNHGLFVAMPNRSYKDVNGAKQYSDIAHPFSKEARDVINDAVMKAYHQYETQDTEIEEIDDGEVICQSM